MQNPLRNIPSVNELLERPQLRNLVDSVSHHVVVSGVRTFLDDFRKEVHAAASEVQIVGWVRREGLRRPASLGRSSTS